MSPAAERVPDALLADPPEDATGGATGQRPVGLTREQLHAIAQARWQGRKISRAARVAAFSGWTMAVFAFITLLSGLFSFVSLMLGVGLSIVSYYELRGSKRLRALDDRAPILLGFNQIALLAIIVLYCSWGIWQAVFGPSPYDSYLAAGGDTAELIEPIYELNRAIMSAFYVFILCISVVIQGCGALYYFTRRRHLVAYLRNTPEWVIGMLRIVDR